MEIINNFYLYKKDRDRIKSQIKEEQISYKELNQSLELHKIYKEIIFSVRKGFIEKMKSKFEKIQNVALKNIFTDRYYKFNLNIKEKRNRPVALIDIHKKQNDKLVSVKLSRSGNGVKSVLQLSSILSGIILSDKEKFIWIDELGTGISKKKDYFNNSMIFLKDIIEEFGIQLVFITHEDIVKDFADTCIEITCDDNTGFGKVEEN